MRFIVVGPTHGYYSAVPQFFVSCQRQTQEIIPSKSSLEVAPTSLAQRTRHTQKICADVTYLQFPIHIRFPSRCRIWFSQFHSQFGPKKERISSRDLKL